MEYDDTAILDSLMEEEFSFCESSSSGTMAKVSSREDNGEQSSWDPDTTLVGCWEISGAGDQDGEDLPDDFMDVGSEYFPDDEDEEPAPDEPVTGVDGDHTELPAVGWSSDMLQTDQMASVGIAVNTRARVVLCLECRQAIRPKLLYDHIRHHPPMELALHICNDIAETHDLLPDPETRPGAVIAAVYGLDLLSGYLSCDTCGYACKSKKTMERHKKKSTHSSFSDSRYVQTFVSSAHRMYFGVQLPNAEVAEEIFDPVTYLKQKFAPTPFQHIPITSPQDPRDAHHFLQIEHWGKFVAGRTGAEITTVVREREPELRAEVRTCVELFAKELASKLVAEGNPAQVAIGDYAG